MPKSTRRPAPQRPAARRVAPPAQLSLPGRAISGLIMLVGVGVLLAQHALWPWIIAVIGLASAPYAAQRGGWVAGAMVAGWLIALAALIDRGLFWPGIVALLAVVVVLRAAITRTRR